MSQPSAGRCWFCGRDTGELHFDEEFDTYVHLDCIRKALAEGDEEAKLMAYLLAADS